MEIRKNPNARLENKRYLFFEIGFIVALLFVLVAFEYKSYESDVIPTDFIFPGAETDVLPPITRQEPEKPKPQPQPTRNIVIDISPDNLDDYLIDVNIDPEEPSYDMPSHYFGDEDSVPDDIIIRVVSEHAKFPGGMAALYQFLRDNLNYPEVAKSVGVQGRVYVDFVVEKDGSISNIVLVRGIGYGCDEEAMRVIALMPAWKPAKQNGRTVRYALTLPVKFTLR